VRTKWHLFYGEIQSGCWIYTPPLRFPYFPTKLMQRLQLTEWLQNGWYGSTGSINTESNRQKIWLVVTCPPCNNLVSLTTKLTPSLPAGVPPASNSFDLCRTWECSYTRMWRTGQARQKCWDCVGSDVRAYRCGCWKGQWMWMWGLASK